MESQLAQMNAMKNQLEKSKEEVKRLTDEAIDILKKLPYENDFLMDLLQYLVYRDN